MATPAKRRVKPKQLDRVFAALANPTRRRLLMRLAEGPASIGELAEPFAMSLPAVSSHIRVLEGVGLLRRRREGRVHTCTLDPAPLRDARDFVDRYRAYWDDTLAALARYAEDESSFPEENDSND
jgi:DNA-binding transcriptional ArsR family regulator